MGRKAGLTEVKLRALADFESSNEFTELEKLALRYAVETTRTEVEIPDELFEELRRHLTDAQLVELTSAIAWENYRARFNHALGMEAEGFSKGKFCPLPDRATTEWVEARVAILACRRSAPAGPAAQRGEDGFVLGERLTGLRRGSLGGTEAGCELAT